MEVGVHRGDFSARLLRDLRPRELHLVDPWRLQRSATYAEAWYGGRATGGAAEMDARCAGVRQRFAAEIASGVVRIHRCTSEVALAGFPDAHFDWIYIDGDHRFEAVARDLALAARKVRPGGAVAGDDYGTAGWWEDGVTRAVDAFVQARPSLALRRFGDQFLITRTGAT
jgi:hypothetical protein